MLQTSDEEIDQRIDAMMPGGGTVQASGMPPLVPFVPKALLLRVHNAVAAVEFQRRGSKQAGAPQGRRRGSAAAHGFAHGAPMPSTQIWA